MLRTYIIICALCSAVPFTSGITCIHMDCKSANSFKQCTVEGAQSIVRVRVVTKVLRSPCNYLHSYGYSDNYIWVDKGCKATFEVCSVYPVTTPNMTLVLRRSTTLSPLTPQGITPTTWVTELTPRSAEPALSTNMTKHLPASVLSTAPITTVNVRASEPIERNPPTASVYESTFEIIASTTTTSVPKLPASTTTTQHPSSNLTTATKLSTTPPTSSRPSAPTVILPTSSVKTILTTTSPVVTGKTVNEAFRNKKEIESSRQDNTYIAGAIITGLVLIALISGCVAIVSLRNACIKVSPSAGIVINGK